MKYLSLGCALAAIFVLSIGCEKPSTTTPAPAGTQTGDDGHNHDAHAGHDHAASDHAPPHGGHLIELGRNHEYHAELVDDDKSKSVTIYVMDGDMKPLSIKESTVSLVLTAGDDTQTFELPAIQADGSSEFKLSDEKLMGLIDTEGMKGKLRVQIDGKPFTGSFDHAHHDHAHE